MGMCAMLMLALSTFSSYVAALPFIREEWGIGNTAAGAVFSCYLAGYAVSALVALPLTDRAPTRLMFLSCAAISLAANALFPIAARGVAAACALRFAAGVGLVGMYMPGLRIIASRFPASSRGAAMGMYVTAFYAASAVSLVATGALMSRLEWREAYLALAIASALSIPMAAYLVGGDAERNRSASASGGMLRFEPLSNRATRAYIVGYTLHAVELYAVRVWLPQLLAATLVGRGESVGDAAVTAAAVGGVALAAGSAGPVVGGALSDRFGRARSAMAIFALSGACCFAIGWVSAIPWPLAVALSCALGWTIAADSSIYSTAIAESAPAGMLGSAMALQAFSGFMGGVVGPILVGAILDAAPASIEWRIGFGGVALLSLFAIATMRPIRERARRRHESTG